ncbi:hypothetical protein BDV18DRAFT_162399 [Aspergillus unguis]
MASQHENSQVNILCNTDKPPKQSPARTQRKRASKACLACRARKIRCDVSVHGKPCMNCRVAGGECVVTARPSKYSFWPKKAAQRSNDEHRITPLSPVSRLGRDGLSETNSSHPQARSPGSQPQSLRSNETCGNSPFLGDINTDFWQSISNSSPSLPGQGTGILAWYDTQAHVDLSVLLNTDEQNQTSPTSEALNGSLLQEICGILGAGQTRTTLTNHSRHPLIKLDDFSQNAAQDIEFMRAHGCFLIPVAPALGEFMQHYFLHVHPMLPMLDEAASWNAFDGVTSTPSLDFPISIFTFQAMLFACCSFVPLDVLRAVGLGSIREARKVLCRRAKLLFDFNGKRDPVATAQGALLLSYSPDTNDRTTNTSWLGIAIQNARKANAHAYNVIPTMTEHERLRKKRLFWCCILRDRILPLGVRRSIYITNAHFDFANNPALTVDDLKGEITRSRVYDARTKQLLAELAVSLCGLAVALTDVIMILYPVDQLPVSSIASDAAPRVQSHIDRARSSLTRWYESTIVRFPTPAGIGDAHGSLVLYTNLMYLYYHSAKMALCHHELLVWKVGNGRLDSSAPQLHQAKGSLESEAACITDIVKELLQLKLIKYLPITAVAYIALPLALSILDVKLSLTDVQSATRQRRLQIFAEAMKSLQAYYDGTDRVSDAIERLVHHLAAAPGPSSSFEGHTRQQPSRQTKQKHPVSEWSDILDRLPGCYLRIAVTLDLAISTGEYPDEQAFPAWLQTRSLASCLPLCGAVRGREGESRRMDSRVEEYPEYSSSSSQPRALQWCNGEHPAGVSVSRLEVEGTLNNDTAALEPDARDWLLDAQIYGVLQDFY